MRLEGKCSATAQNSAINISVSFEVCLLEREILRDVARRHLELMLL